MTHATEFDVVNLEIACHIMNSLQFNVRVSTDFRDQPEVLLITAAALPSDVMWYFYPLFSGRHVVVAPDATTCYADFTDGFDALKRSALRATRAGLRVMRPRPAPLITFRDQLTIAV